MFDEARLFRRRALAITLLALVIVFVLWNVGQFDAVLFPFRLFVTFVHESAHGLAAIATGGQFNNLAVSGNGAGIAQTVGGNRLIILPAGYLGAAFFGAFLFYLTNALVYSRQISMALGVGSIALSLLYTDFATTAFIIGILSGLVLIVIGWSGGRDLNRLILNVLAMMTALNAVFDLIFLVENANATLGILRNDASAFADAVGVLPAEFWAFLWAGIALLMVALAMYYSVIRSLRSL